MRHRLLLAMIALLVAAGCKEQRQPVEPSAAAPPPAAAAAPEAERDVRERFWDEIREHMLAGRTNAALEQLTASLTDSDLPIDRRRVAEQILWTHLQIDDVDSAMAAFAGIAETDGELAANAIGIIASYLTGNQDYEGLASWSESILAYDLPERGRQNAFATWLDAYRTAGRIDDLLRTLPRCTTELPPAAAKRVVDQLLANMLRARQYADLDVLLAALEADHADLPGLAPAVADVRISSLLQQGRLDDSAAAYRETKALLNDEQSARLVNRVAQLAARARRVAVGEAICEEEINNRAADSRTFAAAASRWLEFATKTGNATTAADRLGTVLDKGGPFARRLSYLERSFYFIMDQGEMAARKAILARCQQLGGEAVDENEQARVTALLLDGSFMVEDYALAVQLVEAGIPGKDEAWHATVTPKVKAHLALASGDTREAIRMFRAFMDAIADTTESLPDPVSGMMVSVDVILGLNWIRIADLWDSIDEKEKAAAAREQGRDHYRKALEAEEEGSKERAEIARKLEELGP